MTLDKQSTNEINIDDDFESALKLAYKLYYSGSTFIYPTDTIYGFGANPFNKEAIDEISRIKQRSEDKKYILLIPGIDTLMRYCKFVDDIHVDFLMRIWPNPISVILPLNTETAEILECESAAFRIPSHHFCQKLLETISAPLISTSVNRSGEPPLNDYENILQEFRDDVKTIFYSHKTQQRISSTVIDLTSQRPVLIRQGRMSYSFITQEFNETVAEYSKKAGK